MKIISMPTPEKDDPIFREGLKISIPVHTKNESSKSDDSDTLNAGKSSDNEAPNDNTV
jgi:hypothetical protein